MLASSQYYTNCILGKKLNTNDSADGKMRKKKKYLFIHLKSIFYKSDTGVPFQNRRFRRCETTGGAIQHRPAYRHVRFVSNNYHNRKSDATCLTACAQMTDIFWFLQPFDVLLLHTSRCENVLTLFVRKKNRTKLHKRPVVRFYFVTSGRPEKFEVFAGP